MAAVSLSNDAIRGGPCSRSPDRIVNTYSGNCGSFRPRALTLQSLPQVFCPKAFAQVLWLRSASRSEVCPRPTSSAEEGTAWRLGATVAGRCDRRLTGTCPNGERRGRLGRELGTDSSPCCRHATIRFGDGRTVRSRQIFNLKLHFSALRCPDRALSGGPRTGRPRKSVDKCIARMSGGHIALCGRERGRVYDY
jgi:hypothetical protein